MPASAPAPASVSACAESKKSAGGGKPGRGLARQALASTCIWMVAILLLVDLGLSQLRPLRFVSLKYIPVDQNPIVSKIPEFFNAQKPSDVLIVGSSLPMTAFALADDLFKTDLGEREITVIRTYTGADYLSRLLQGQLHKSTSCFNLSCIGCMVSDTHLLVSRAIDAGKKPRLLIFGIAPRDFIDNVALPIGKTPCYEVLSDWRCLSDLTQRSMSQEKVRDLLLSCFWYYYRVKVDYKTFFLSIACDAFSRPMSLYDAAKAGARSTQAPAAGTAGAAPDAPPKGAGTAPACPIAPIHMMSSATDARCSDSLAEYKSHYDPPNRTRYQQEAVYLTKLLTLCRKEAIPVVLVNMPLTKANRELLDPALYKEYAANLEKAAATTGATLIDLQADDADFPLSSFSDSVHLNRTGSAKFQHVLLTKMQERGVLKAIK